MGAPSLLLVSVSFSLPAVATSAAPIRSVDLIGSDDMKYSITTLTARRGEILRIRLISKGTISKAPWRTTVVVLKLGTDVLKLLKDGAPHRGTDFIPRPPDRSRRRQIPHKPGVFRSREWRSADEARSVQRMHRVDDGIGVALWSLQRPLGCASLRRLPALAGQLSRRMRGVGDPETL